MTGSLGDCGVGDEEAEQFKEDMKEQGLDIYFFDGMITSKPDDHGCYRPVAMTDQDGNGYNSLEIYFDGKPTKEMLDLMRERAVAYGIQNSIAVRDVKLYNKITSTQYLEEIL
jgi:hypothetical protein